MNMLDGERLMNIARETVQSTPIPIPKEIEELLVGIMVGMYLKGFKDGVKSMNLTSDMLMKEVEKADAEVSNLYNIRR